MRSIVIDLLDADAKLFLEHLVNWQGQIGIIIGDPDDIENQQSHTIVAQQVWEKKYGDSS